MSAILDLESTPDQSSPAELYEFLGSYKNYYYASAAEEFTFNGVVYTPIVDLSRDSAKIGTDSDQNNAMKVTLPVTAELITDYGFQTTPPQLGLNLYRIDRNLTPYESNFRTLWSGPVSSINIKGKTAEIDVPSILSSLLAGSCPTFYFQSPCNHVLFDPNTCRVSRVANSVNATVAQVLSGGQVLQMSTYGAFAITDFIAGEVLIASQNERRMIIGADAGAGTLTVNYPFGKVTVGTSVQFTRGCDHAWKGHCKTRYNNTLRFGGHPLIPNVNVFASGLG